MNRKITILTVFLSLFALSASAGWDEGVAAFTSKDFKAAAESFRTLVDQNPDAWKSHYMLGLSLARLGHKEESLNHLGKAYDLNPNELSIKQDIDTVRETYPKKLSKIELGRTVLQKLKIGGGS